MSRNKKYGPWSVRRRFMTVIVGFCMGVIMYILLRNMVGEVAETSITMAFTIIGSTMASYVFGATWEDINSRKDKE